jgi:hypothetical protein
VAALLLTGCALERGGTGVDEPSPTPPRSWPPPPAADGATRPAPPPEEDCVPGTVVGEATVRSWCEGRFCSTPCNVCDEPTGVARCVAWPEHGVGECPPRTGVACPDDTAWDVVWFDGEGTTSNPWVERFVCLARCDSASRAPEP